MALQRRACPADLVAALTVLLPAFQLHGFSLLEPTLSDILNVVVIVLILSQQRRLLEPGVLR
jgi:hypothetical protein